MGPKKRQPPTAASPEMPMSQLSTASSYEEENVGPGEEKQATEDTQQSIEEKQAAAGAAHDRRIEELTVRVRKAEEMILSSPETRQQFRGQALRLEELLEHREGLEAKLTTLNEEIDAVQADVLGAFTAAMEHKKFLVYGKRNTRGVRPKEEFASPREGEK